MFQLSSICQPWLHLLVLLPRFSSYRPVPSAAAVVVVVPALILGSLGGSLAHREREREIPPRPPTCLPEGEKEREEYLATGDG